MSTRPGDTTAGAQQFDERYFVASSWTLMRRRFMRHRLALIGGVVLAVIYLLAIFADFSPYPGAICATRSTCTRRLPKCDWCTKAACARRSYMACR